MKCAVCCTCVLLLAAVLRAQPQTILLLRGEIVDENANSMSTLYVELRNLNHPQPGVRVPVAHDGTFELRQVEAGHYEAKITTLSGNVIQDDVVQILPTGEPLRLRLRLPKQSAPGSGAVSARALLHRVPSKAEKEFRRAREASKRGNTEEAIAHLEKALQADSGYMEARNNLGVCYMGLNQYARAAEEFQKTVDLDPESAKGQLNLSLALSSLRRYPEAEAAARKAVRLEPSVGAHYALGQILAAQEKNTPEAVENLRESVEALPAARLIVARVLVRQGALADAASELRQYLNSGNTLKRQEAESWLQRLRQAGAISNETGEK